MTCEFCDIQLSQPGQIQVRDHNGFVAAEYEACDPCAFSLIKSLEFLAANKGTLRQGSLRQVAAQEDGTLAADVVS